MSPADSQCLVLWECLICKTRPGSLQVAIPTSGCLHALVKYVTLTLKEMLQPSQVCLGLHTRPARCVHKADCVAPRNMLLILL